MATSDVLLTKPTRYQDAATKSWIPGHFILYASKITWQPSNQSGAPASFAAGALHIGLISITNTQRAKGKPLLRITSGTTGHTFEFESELDRDSAVDAYTKAKDALAANGSAAASGPQKGAASAPSAGATQRAGAGAKGAGVAAAGLPTPEQKRDMIRDDPELAERYNTLVAAAGVLQEDEFWAGVMAERSKVAVAAAAIGGAPGSSEVRPLPLPPGAPEQKRGLSNAMFQVPVEQDGRSVAMRFTLTPDLIALVFAEKPHVKRAYDKNVPVNLSEKEFWTRYLKHEMAKEERRKKLLGSAAPAEGAGSGAAESMLADAPPPEHAALFGEGDGTDKEGRRQRRRVLLRSDPTVNLDADAGDGFAPEFGLMHAASKEPVLRGGLRAMAEDLARDINRHATVVLAGVDVLASGSKHDAKHDAGRSGTAAAAAAGAGSSKGQGSRRSSPGKEEGAGPQEALDDLAAARLAEYGSSLEDLRETEKAAYEELRITDPRAYFDRLSSGAAADGQGAGNGSSAGGTSAHARGASQGGGGWLQEFQEEEARAAESLAAVDPNNLSCPPIESDRAYEVLMEVCGMGPSSMLGEIGQESTGPAGLAQPPDAVLAPALLTKFRTQVKMVADVARHFWACLPADTPEKRDKVDRLAAHVDSVLWSEVEGAITTANRMGGPQRPYVRQLLNPALRMMEVLLERHKQERAVSRAQR